MASLEDLLQSAQRAFKNDRPDKAATRLQEVLSQDPDNSIAHYILGLITAGDGNNADALKHLGKAASWDSNDPRVYYNYGLVLQRTAQYHKAITQYEKALSIRPGYIQALNNYSAALLITGSMTKAEAAARKVIALNASHVDPHVNLGNILKDTGYIQSALESYRNALALQPDNAVAGSNMLLCLCYSTLDNDCIFDEHKAWEDRVGKGISRKSTVTSRPDPDKSPLRVGYISADFKTHSVAFFIEPILEHHDSSQFEIVCYADVPNPDPVTLRLKKHAAIWRPVSGMNNNTLFDRMIRDDLDILVDLSGHAGKNRLPLFLRRPAPLQVTYLGYPNTTGLSTMDYRLTDPWADPAGQDRYYTEKLYRLSNGFLCYRPAAQAPPISPAPVTKNGYITFGSFNNLPKMSPDTIRVWSEILTALPRSRLMLKTKPFNDDSVKKRYINMFVNNGIDAGRLLFNGHAPSLEAHLACYHKVDIGLDTFPYNGTTTTCEALWMGVPVITLAGNHHRGRVGASLLSRIGLTGMVVENHEKYVALARFLAGDIERLPKLRRGLRASIARSPLCDGASFTRTLEKAYRDMWQQKFKVCC